MSHTRTLTSWSRRNGGLEPDPPPGQDVVELPAVYGPIVRHGGNAAVPRDVEHHAARDDAFGPVLDRSEPRALERDLLLRVAPVPHRLLVPGVAQRVDVGGGDAVIVDAVVVGRKAALTAHGRLHEVVSRQRVVRARLLGEGPTERHAAAVLDEPGGRRALGRGDEVD